MLLTARDRELVEWIARFGAVAAEQLIGWFGIGRTAAYRRLRACVESGLLVRLRLLHGEPGLYMATRQGLAWAGLGGYEPCRVSLSLVRQVQASVRAAVVLAQRESVRASCPRLALGRPGWRLGLSSLRARPPRQAR